MVSRALESLFDIRQHELRKVLPRIKAGSRVLEIGAGAGWQALGLHEAGHCVTAIDLPTNKFLKSAVFPVEVFDGEILPFRDGQFDAVFSSNVVEHIKDFDTFSLELKRVLSSDGVAIHIVPSATWRFWTSLGHPVYLLKLIYGMATSVKEVSARAVFLDKLSEYQTKRWGKWLRLWYSQRHGERGTAVSELLTFSRWGWKKFFMQAGWHVESYMPSGIFYTGDQIFEKKLSTGCRRGLARIFGSSTLIFTLRN